MFKCNQESKWAPYHPRVLHSTYHCVATFITYIHVYIYIFTHFLISADTIFWNSQQARQIISSVGIGRTDLIWFSCQDIPRCDPLRPCIYSCHKEEVQTHSTSLVSSWSAFFWLRLLYLHAYVCWLFPRIFWITCPFPLDKSQSLMTSNGIPVCVA